MKLGFQNRDEVEFVKLSSSISLDSLTEVMERLNNLTEEVKQLKVSSSDNAVLAEENRKRHENVDISMRRLCPLIDEIFDVASPPGGTRYDCCYEEYTGTPGKIGNAMMCMTESFLGISNNAPFPRTSTGRCASTCGYLPAALQANSSMLIQKYLP